MSTTAPCRQLHRDKEVIFAGYKFPHPLEYHIFIKVQTTGRKSPREAFDDSLTDLINELDDVRSKFQVCIIQCRCQQAQPYQRQSSQAVPVEVCCPFRAKASVSECSLLPGLAHSDNSLLRVRGLWCSAE